MRLALSNHGLRASGGIERYALTVVRGLHVLGVRPTVISKAFDTTLPEYGWVEPLRVNEQDKKSLVGTGRTFVCVDTVGAGEGGVVLIVQGSSARFSAENKAMAKHSRGKHRDRHELGLVARGVGNQLS